MPVAAGNLTYAFNTHCVPGSVQDLEIGWWKVRHNPRFKGFIAWEDTYRGIPNVAILLG